jgi:hypothetical protein
VHGRGRGEKERVGWHAACGGMAPSAARLAWATWAWATAPVRTAAGWEVQAGWLQQLGRLGVLPGRARTGWAESLRVGGWTIGGLAAVWVAGVRTVPRFPCTCASRVEWWVVGFVWRWGRRGLEKGVEGGPGDGLRRPWRRRVRRFPRRPRRLRRGERADRLRLPGRARGLRCVPRLLRTLEAE